MPLLIVTNRNGEESQVDVPSGLSLMQVLCDAGFDEVLALCGGVCSCATCHVYVSGDAASGLTSMSEDEHILLDSSSHRREASRLSCQILVSDELDGLRIKIAPED